MRLAFVLLGELTTLTGGFLYDRMLIKGLEKHGISVSVIQLPWRSYPISILDPSANQLIEQLVDGNFDLVIQDELAHPALFRTNRKIKQRFDLPLISLVHHLRSSEDHPALLKLIYRGVERRYLQTVDGIIANSPATFGAVESLLERRVPAVIAPPGRDHYESGTTENHIRLRSQQDGPLKILFLGSIIPRKRLEDVILALQVFHQLDFQLTIIGPDSGESSYVREIRALISATALEDRVHWLGQQPIEEVTRALAESHLLVVPSSHEGFGIAYLDAMGSGVVPIGSTCGGAAALIDHAHNGFLIDPRDRESLSNYIQTLANDRALLTEMALNAYRRYQQQPTWYQVSRKVYDYVHSTF